MGRQTQAWARYITNLNCGLPILNQISNNQNSSKNIYLLEKMLLKCQKDLSRSPPGLPPESKGFNANCMQWKNPTPQNTIAQRSPRNSKFAQNSNFYLYFQGEIDFSFFVPHFSLKNEEQKKGKNEILRFRCNPYPQLSTNWNLFLLSKKQGSIARNLAHQPYVFKRPKLSDFFFGSKIRDPR